MSEKVDDYTEDGVFDLDRWQDEAAGEPYAFAWGGKDRTLPHVRDLPADILPALTRIDQGDVDAIPTLLAAAFGQDEWAEMNAARTMSFGALTELFNRWMRRCGVDPGEAQSFAGSLNGTAKRSKRTSAGTTASGSTGRSTAARKSGTRRVNSSR